MSEQRGLSAYEQDCRYNSLYVLILMALSYLSASGYALLLDVRFSQQLLLVSFMPLCPLLLTVAGGVLCDLWLLMGEGILRVRMDGEDG